MRILTFFWCLLLLTTVSYAQAPNQIWSPIESSRIPLVGKRYIKPTTFRTFKANLTELRAVLATAPMTKTAAVKTKPCFVAIPWTDGSIKQFQITESPIMQEGLQAEFPEIRTYAGSEVGNSSNYIRLDLTPQGFHALIWTADQGTVYIDPYTHGGGDLEHYICYNKKYYTQHGKTAICDAKGEAVDVGQFQPKSAARFGSCELRTYALALAATGEYTTFHGGTVALAQAAQVTTMNRVNGMYIREMAIQMNIVNNNSSIIYTNSNTDPFSNGVTNDMINENQTVCDNIIGSGNYDIGHVFGTNSGGLAGLGVICTNSKARGVTGSAAPIGDPFDIDFVAHEMGHQFGATHTQNNNCNRESTTSMEPGSGSTIMGYAGICAPNVQASSDDYFHSISLQQISNRILSSNCATRTALSNAAPSITSTPTSGITIPANTPFSLTAVATDPNASNVLTYCWEQMDNAAATMPPVSSATDGPNFRSLSPSTNATRYFPNLTDLAAGVSPTWEVLPSVGRSMTFRVTVRDNAPGGACSDHQDLAINVHAGSGPFVVNYPSNTGISWSGLATETVTWSVANTNNAPVACTAVDVLLSTDGGQTYTTTLASNVPNSGSYALSVPNINTNTARIMIRCANGTFFDISDNNFSIAAAASDYTLAVTPSTTSICQGTNGTFTINIGKIGTYNNPVTLSLSGTPPGASINFSPSSVTPVGSSTLTVGNTAAIAAGSYNMTVIASSTSGTKTENITLIVDAAISSPTLTTPTNGAASVSPSTTFGWTAVGNSSTVYDVTIATNASFSNIVDNATGITTNNYTSTVLNGNTTYYWRVTASNGCGSPATSTVFSFTTNSCSVFNSTDPSQVISTIGTPTVTSTVNVSTTGSLVDINIVNLTGTHSYVSDLTFTLTSPSNTSVQFISGICTSSDNFNLNIDDAGAATIPCPPTTGLTYQPLNPLSAFNGENPAGTWTLTVFDGSTQDGGSLDSWGLEVCATTATIIDAGISSFVNPADGFATCDNPVVPVVRLQNYGTTPLTSTTINYDINGGANNTFSWTGNLAAGDSIDVILPAITAPTPATFTLNAATSNPNGGTDSNTANDGASALSQIILAATLPYMEDFSTGAIPANITTIENPVDNNPWSYNAASAYSTGTGSMILDNFNTNTAGDFDLAYLPWLDFSGQTGVQLTFDVAYARYDAASSDTIAIYASNDCGDSYTLIYRKGGTDLATAPDNLGSFLPTATQWRNETVSLAAYNGSSHVRLIFVNEGGYGNNVYLDNINIASPIACNVAATAAITNPISCNGSADGSIGVTATNGQIPYTYNIGNGNQNSNNFNNLGVGNYTVTVTDANGCTATTNTVSVTEPNVISVNITTPNMISCNGGNDGSLTVNATQRVPPYTYVWSNGQTSSVANMLSAGTYTVTAIGGNGCTATGTVTLNEPTAITTSLAVVNTISCANSNTGRIQATTSGGTSPYTYSLGTGSQTTPTFSNLAAGTYTVTTTDANGCTAMTNSVTLSDPSTVVPTISLVSPINCPNGSTGALSVTATGGNPNSYTYSWSNGQNGASIVNLMAGTYTVTATDASGCTATANYTLSDPTAILPTIIATSTISCNGGNNGALSASATGGNASNYTYLWSNGQAIDNISNLVAGTYSVTVTDANGCVATTSRTLNNPAPIVASATVTSQAGCSGSNTGAITAAATGGSTNNYTYLWSNGQATASISNLPAGTYTVTATDNGCSGTTSATISPAGNLTVNTTINSTIDCNGDATGSVTAAANGGNTANYTYAWSNGQATASISNLPAGTYTVTATNNGCTAVSTVTLSQPTLLTATANDNGDGSATVLPNGGTANYTYLWSDGQVNATAANLTNGTYTVTVTDANNCSTTASVTVIVSGLDNIANLSAFDILPNPNTGNFHVQIDLTTVQAGNVQVVNVLGQVLRTYNFEAQSVTLPIEIQEQTSGVYFVVLNTSNQTVTRKVTVSK